MVLHESLVKISVLLHEIISNKALWYSMNLPVQISVVLYEILSKQRLVVLHEITRTELCGTPCAYFPLLYSLHIFVIMYFCKYKALCEFVMQYGSEITPALITIYGTFWNSYIRMSDYEG